MLTPTLLVPIFSTDIVTPGTALSTLLVGLVMATPLTVSLAFWPALLCFMFCVPFGA